MTDAAAKPEAVTIQTSYALANEQVTAAQNEIMQDYSELGRLPWDVIDDLVGTPLPRDLWIVGARPSNGKTTFLLNLFDSFVTRGWPTLYIGAGAEGPPKDVRRQWSALRCGYPSDLVLENRWEHLPDKARENVFADLQRQATECHETAHFHEAGEKLTSEALIGAMNYAKRHHCRYVILDHIHRVRFDARQDERRALSETTRWLRDMAAKYDMVVFIGAQLSRGSADKGPLRDLVPPTMEDLKGTGTLEEDAVVGLLLHRTRRAGVTPKDVTDVMKNIKSVEDIVEPGTMCVRVGKQRRRGHMIGRSAFLRVAHSARLTSRSSPYITQPELSREPGDDVPF